MSIADRKAREKEQRRSDIINAAEKLFFLKGYDNVSMEDIAKEVELNRATIYLYFKNKEALFYAIVLRGVRMLNAWVKEGVEKAPTSVRKINAIFNTHGLFMGRYPDYFRAYNYFQSGRFDIPNDEEADEDLKEIIQLQLEIYEITLDVVKSGINDGTLRSDLKPLDVAVLIISTCDAVLNVRPGLKKLSPTWHGYEYLSQFMYQLIRKPK